MNKITEIYPVIEMSPWRVNENANLKTGEDYEKFALGVFNDAGIKNINRLDKYAYSSIIVSDINDEDLSVLIKKGLQDAEISKYQLENVCDFEGGLVIRFENGEVINHSCCGSLSNYKNWLELIKDKPKYWKEIWIGHPWIYGKVRENKILLSNLLDETNPKPKENDAKFEIDFLDFKNKLLDAINDLALLKKRIRTILLNERNQFANELPELLIENELKMNPKNV
jgi:hypothetical protein